MSGSPAGVKFYAMTAKVSPCGQEVMTHWLAMLDVDGGEWLQQGVTTAERESLARRWAIGDFAGADFVKRGNSTDRLT